MQQGGIFQCHDFFFSFFSFLSTPMYSSESIFLFDYFPHLHNYVRLHCWGYLLFEPALVSLIDMIPA